MTLRKRQIKLFSKNLISLGLFVYMICVPKLLLSQFHLIFNNQSETEILEEVSSTLDVFFNYNSSILSDESHSFSISGNEEHILKIIAQKLEVELFLLEPKIYAVKPLALGELANSEPVFKFEVQSHSGEKLSYATVFFPDLDLIYQTNVEGICTVKGFISDEDKVSIRYLGYENVNTNVGLIKDVQLVIMHSSSHVLSEIVLTDFLSSVKNNELQNKTTIQDVALAGHSDQDLLRKAQLLPGIHSTSESLNDLQIRGGPPDQVSYKWNDIRLLQTSLFYGQVSGVNPFMVDEVTITRNGTSSDQSGQASGSVILETNQQINETGKVKLFSDFLYSNIGVTLPLIKNKLTAKISFRKSHNFLFDSRMYQNYFDQSFQFGRLNNDQFYINFFDIRGQEEIQRSFNFDDLSANIKWKPTSKLFFSSSFVNLSNRFNYTYFDGLFTDETTSDQLKLSNVGWNLTGKYAISSALKATVSYSGSRYANEYSFERDIGFEHGEDRFKSNRVGQYNINAKLSYQHRYLHIEIGAQNESWDVEYIDSTRVPDLGLFYDNSMVSSEEQSAFLKIQWKFIPRTLIETGVRYSDFGLSLIDRKFIEPRIHLSHYLFSNLTLHSHFGMFHQNLNRRSIFSPLDVEKGIWYLSDERPESSNFIWVVQNRQTSIGVKYLVKNWKFTIDAYNKRASDIWTSALDFSIEEDPFAFADLIVNGIEFSSHFQNKNWKLLWTYEITDERMFIKDESEIEIKSPFTQPHKISLMQSYSAGNWLFSSRWRLNSGRPFSEGARITTINEPEFQYILEYNNILEQRIPNYHTLDVSISYNWLFNKLKNQSVEIGFHIQNVYNRKNVIKRQFFIDYTKTPFEMSFYDRQGIGFTPNLSVLINL